VGHASRSSDLLHVEASWARRWVVHMTSSQRLCRVEIKDGRVDAMGCVGPFYSRITVFYVLDLRGIVVF
jgi:hypothetical protein